MSIKSWITGKLIKKYAGSWIRGGLRVASGFLLAKGLADESTADAFTGALGDIILRLIDSPELLGSLVSGGIGQWWSLKEKKDNEKE